MMRNYVDSMEVETEPRLSRQELQILSAQGQLLSIPVEAMLALTLSNVKPFAMKWSQSSELDIATIKAEWKTLFSEVQEILLDKQHIKLPLQDYFDKEEIYGERREDLIAIGVQAFDITWRECMESGEHFLGSQGIPTYSKQAQVVQLLSDVVSSIEQSFPAYCRRSILESLLEKYFGSPRLVHFRVRVIAAYPYRDLPPGHIRLLTLHPATNDADDIVCDLTSSPLESILSYSALSYVWGGKRTSPPTITLHGQPIIVTENLHKALRSLRKPSSSRVLWVDALCINQQDLNERAQQVSCMREIYERANSVLMWLGDATDDSDLAMKWLVNLCDGLGNLDEEDPNDPLPENYRLFNPDSVDSFRPLIESLRKLFQDRQYWTRLWIVQEAVSSRTALMICGKYAIRWSSLATYLTMPHSHNLHFNLQGAGADPLLIDAFFEPRVIRLAQISSNRLREGTQSITLMEALNLSRQLKATDARDHIFGMYGLLREWDASLVSVSYEKTVLELYRDLVINHIKQSQSLDILSGCKTLPPMLGEWNFLEDRIAAAGCGNIIASLSYFAEKHSSTLARHHNYPDSSGNNGIAKLLNRLKEKAVSLLVQKERNSGDNSVALVELATSSMPSWIPRWNEPLLEHPFGIDTGCVLKDGGSFLASASRTIVSSLKFNSAALCLQGFQFDEVEEVIVYAEHRFRAVEIAWETWNKRCSIPGNNPYGEEDRQREAFRKTCICQDEQQDEDEYFVHVFRSFMKWESIEDPSFLLNFEGGQHPKQKLMQILTNRNLSMFFTRRGYMGRGPTFMKKGDPICILFGGKVPMALHRSGFNEHGPLNNENPQHNPETEFHYLLGECYVHGIMHGEAVAGLDNGEFQKREFILV